jgi:hypothetical protein
MHALTDSQCSNCGAQLTWNRVLIIILVCPIIMAEGKKKAAANKRGRDTKGKEA